MTRKILMFAGALLLSPLLLAQDGPQKASAPAAAGGKQGVPKPTPQASEGQRIFEQNCSRCHNAPEGFSPTISGTVVRHMRVRASISKHDEQELLRFFNP